MVVKGESQIAGPDGCGVGWWTMREDRAGFTLLTTPFAYLHQRPEPTTNFDDFCASVDVPPDGCSHPTTQTPAHTTLTHLVPPPAWLYPRKADSAADEKMGLPYLRTDKQSEVVLPI